ncbi:kinase-like protein [Exidia glandulosa HHB12029]|uniref:Kinase-like protein n=1 Tax=Exidia glandulosa HHB12029 TaxID=1314781 RepID=A0A165EJL2_EXIGL|nr:kinase-like protein [Exidia glandulosa HHB12029]
MANGHLLEYLRRHRHLDRGRHLWQIADALRFLHDDAHLVHGDVKCENVLVSDSGDALLADFGLSTTVEKHLSDLVTSTGICQRGTTRFLAPEVFDNAICNEDSLNAGHVSQIPQSPVRSKTRASDVYAFGMLVLQAMTLVRPWVGLLRDVEVVVQVSLGRYPPHPGNDEHMQDDFTSFYWTNICLNCWRRNPQERPHMRALYTQIKEHHDARGLLLGHIYDWQYGTERYRAKVNRLDNGVWKEMGICYCSVLYANEGQGAIVARSESQFTCTIVAHRIQRKHQYECIRDDLLCFSAEDGSDFTFVFKDSTGRNELLQLIRTIQRRMNAKVLNLNIGFRQ